MKARSLAISVLARVARTDAYLNVALDHALDEHRLADPRDAALATELCYGVARRQLALDAVLERFSDRKLARLEDTVLAALRVGVYQLFYSRVPRRAAVAETVEALKELGFARATGFANAVLRKASELTELPLPPRSELAEHLAVATSHPRWLVERWVQQFGPARAEAMLEADNRPPALTLRANLARTQRDALLTDLREAGLEATPTPLSPVGVLLPSSGRVGDLFGYAEGLWQVQDEAAQLVTVYAAVPEGARVLDVCAAPGGKACHLAERHEVVALDLHPAKLGKIEAEAKRLKVDSRLSVRAHDATTPLPDELGEFDVVLVDAPCSGLGTLRRHPELRYRRAVEDIARLASLQRRILEHAQQKVAPGGLLVYSVCTVDPQEGADQMELFLRSHPEFTSEPPVLEVALPQHQGYLRTLPDQDLDGFFAARLRRTY